MTCSTTWPTWSWRGGQVIVVPREALPTDSGLAAIFRH
jgi:hypothetical protein